MFLSVGPWPCKISKILGYDDLGDVATLTSRSLMSSQERMPTGWYKDGEEPEMRVFPLKVHGGLQPVSWAKMGGRAVENRLKRLPPKLRNIHEPPTIWITVNHYEQL